MPITSICQSRDTWEELKAEKLLAADARVPITGAT